MCRVDIPCAYVSRHGSTQGLRLGCKECSRVSGSIGPGCHARLAACLHWSPYNAPLVAPEVDMDTSTHKGGLEESVQKALTDLEAVTDEIRVKLHLANMDANAAWNEKYEPRLFQAREHAKEAKDASKAAIEDAVKAFKAFAASL